MEYVFDIESDGLLDEATKIHCLSAVPLEGGEPKSLTCYEDIKEFLTSAKTLVGHNIYLYDIPLVEKLLGIKIKAKIVDTLALSWYLKPNRITHGLDKWGEDLGVAKPKIDDWQNLSVEEYCHRCEEDVKINFLLWELLTKELEDLYESKRLAERFQSYLMFKMECAYIQQRDKWKLDKELASKSLETLEKQAEEKLEELRACMPKVPKKVARKKPGKPYKKDGTLSVAGAKWFKLLKDNKLPDTFEGTIEEVVSWDDPNPGSHAQVKDWLFDLGWKPEAFDYKKNEDGSERKIPQVRVEGELGKELCPSVVKLAEKEPSIKVLEGLSIIQHRLAIFEGFLRDERDGFLEAGIGGLTNTLRFKHRTLVNLPGVDKQWGEQIRGSLIARDGYELCGADCVSLEDTTKRHYMWSYDPDYVKEMSKEGFDPHLDLAKFAGVVTQQDIDLYNEGKKDLSTIRKNYKAANYSAIYGVGAAKMARSLDITVNEAKNLIQAFWQRNWSIRKFSEEQQIKHTKEGMWVKNPVNGFWYSLRNEKDIFSTINQGTGVYVFDSWVRNIFEKRKQLTGQFHDEIILEIKKGHRDACEALLKEAIQEVDRKLNLNVRLDVDVQFGERYSEIH